MLIRDVSILTVLSAIARHCIIFFQEQTIKICYTFKQRISVSSHRCLFVLRINGPVNSEVKSNRSVKQGNAFKPGFKPAIGATSPHGKGPRQLNNAAGDWSKV